LRRQEITIATMLGEAGYVTGHFGKWHLNALRGPGVPILKTDDHHPGHFGFDYWLSVTNFFDRDPIMSRMGEFESLKGDSSKIVVSEALQFIGRHAGGDAPTLTVIWFGTPHSPFKAAEEDMASLEHLDEQSRNHYGELVAMDQSLGTLRQGLRKLKIADNTLLWYCSDNGGLPKIQPDTVGGLRGHKGTIYEGGLRVPAVIVWPSGISRPRITMYPASVLDIVPTLLQIASLDHPDPTRPLDGISLVPLFSSDRKRREKPIPFRHIGRAAWLDNDIKLLTNDLEAGEFELYDLNADPAEAKDLSQQRPRLAEKMRTELMRWNDSVNASFEGKDYPEGKVDPGEPKPRFWTEVEQYQPYFQQWRSRWEYRSRLSKRKK
jgi:arylsulfatase A-like enzyme